MHGIAPGPRSTVSLCRHLGLHNFSVLLSVFHAYIGYKVKQQHPRQPLLCTLVGSELAWNHSAVLSLPVGKQRIAQRAGRLQL